MLLMALMMADATPARATPAPVSIEQQVRAADDAYWTAFNACDEAGMAAALSPDIEFYHDKTGATISRGPVVRSLMDGPCGTPGLHVRREVVAGSVSYDAVPGFGAISTGRHRFYARRDGQNERLDGEARFAIVWQDLHGRFVMRRVLSYAHGPALDQPVMPSVDIPPVTLRRYVGVYASAMGSIAVTLVDDRLHLASGDLATDLVPVATTVFRARDRPLLFEFAGPDGGPGTITVRENGAIVAEGVRTAR
ncbi:DUF4440 domain-containing protein [Sphingomonas sp. KR1UV-12]|uniref:DUF4440 domain-containing protein n=1 Tax=Sphingomonas aurea TaxID=3063994 RepID=A0ABT9EJL3_9SPHN|nr:DUF4440 domain-containing protein [Sphingomonas sp. KR1UV-12]MDP1027134.1 DUF4440 domain-containing protein [Sphingomonas sp. KR1UV-12]